LSTRGAVPRLGTALGPDTTGVLDLRAGSDIDQLQHQMQIPQWADLLGPRGIRATTPQEIDEAWDTALTADRPVVIHAVVDPAIPLLPPGQLTEKMQPMYQGLNAENTDLARRGQTHLRRERADEGYDDK
jgi:hypothetical protein